MTESAHRSVAVVGVSAIMPEAPDAATFWQHIRDGRYCISDVPVERWDPELYYDPDPKAPDKTYSRIGGWVREFAWDPMGWHLPVPPRVAEAMDDAQKWAINLTRALLADYGDDERPIDRERTAVILGNAMAGEKHYLTTLRIAFPEVARRLEQSEHFRGLPPEVRQAIITEAHEGLVAGLPEITEDTMPGELANILAGRVANLFDLHGPNYVVDAACASAMAAIDAAIEGLVEHEFDAAITGGLDRNMGASSFVKFCKIGALSATGTRPYADGADGFVMGEGGALFLLKRYEDAVRNGDRIYGVLRGIAGSSDGRGKGITAPNPLGQRLAVERAWAGAGLAPETATYVEGHGTSTRVGDVVEVEALGDVFGRAAVGSIALGSVKSNIGHLKAAAGAAGILKTVMALHDKVLPPSLNCTEPNPNIDFASSPLRVNPELREWPEPECGVRRAGVSAFGFGGTNFHVVLEEYVPGRLDGNGSGGRSTTSFAGTGLPLGREAVTPKAPLRGALVVGGVDDAAVASRLRSVLAEAEAGRAPAPMPPAAADLAAPRRVAIDYGDAAELAEKIPLALAALESGQPVRWKALAARGVFAGAGPAAKVAFLFTGQGSQYVDMLRELADIEPIVADTFAEADAVMTPLLGRPLTDHIFSAPDDDDEARREREQQLRQTEITQPAVLTVDAALARLFAAYGIRPDMVMGHSLGEYGALVEAGALPFADALEAVSARGREMADLEIDDKGAMVAAQGALEDIVRVVDEVGGRVWVANVNSTKQAVIGGATADVEVADAALRDAGITTVRLPVSHAFHTEIVAPASEPLRQTLTRLDLRAPEVPVVANVDGQFYPAGGPDIRDRIIEILGRQVASPVQFVAGLETLYDAGARVLVEVGPKRALQGFAAEVLGDRPDTVALSSNHPRTGTITSFNQALCGLYAAGLGAGAEGAAAPPTPAPAEVTTPAARGTSTVAAAPPPGGDETLLELGRLFADFLEKGRAIYAHTDAPAASSARPAASTEPVVITGAALGLPGTAHVFDDDNVGRLLDGEQLIGLIPATARQDILDKHITRLVKRDDGDPTFEPIESTDDVIKLAARAGELDVVAEFGVEEDRAPALGRETELAIGAGLDALRDAGIPLVMGYRATSIGTQLPTTWGLPATMRDDTGVIFASAFPGYTDFAEELDRYHADRARRHEIATLEAVLARLDGEEGSIVAAELERRLHELRHEQARDGYHFDRRFLFRVLSMGHSQFAELIGARGPNTQVNAACASTTQAVAVAQDWIRAGRCRRVVVVAADDVTSDELLEWIGAGFVSTGAAATDDRVEDAALPFDRRRHGMILGMGAAGLVVESAESARERGIRPICEVLGTVTANSAFHGTRLDLEHICTVMDEVVQQAEAHGADRHDLAGRTVFISHETYTPARGGSASAEIHALRHTFGADADRVVIANTKGFTGHPMGVGIEDVVAVKALETGIVPPVANFRDVDPELGSLNLSKGGVYPVDHALRLAAGFGSQISMMMLRWVPSPDGRHPAPDELGHASRIADPAAWQRFLADVSGRPDAAVEIVQRRLRVVDHGPATTAPPVPRVDAPAVPDAPAAVGVNAPVAEPEAASGSSPASDPVVLRVLEIVAAETGYPPDLLDLDLDLEADLGIDTVKQAETFAAIRESFGIERDPDLKLRDYPTLAHVVGFVRDRATGLPAAPEAPAPAAGAPSGEEVTAPAPVAAGQDDVVAEVLQIVAAETGYPPDLLDLDLDLEADLGIDTVKQAETFAAIRESFDIERDPDLKLRDYPTLAHVVEFVRARRPGLPAAVPPSTPEATAPAPAAGAPSDEEVIERVLTVVEAATGYPRDMLDLDLDLEADLGIDTVKQAETFAAIRESFGIERDPDLKLRDYPTLAHVVRFVRDRAPALAPAPATEVDVVTPSPKVTVPTAADLADADGVPRRIPVPEGRPALASCRETGVVLDADSRVLVAADEGGVGAALVEQLAAAGVTVHTLDLSLDADGVAAAVAGARADGPLQGVFWLPALDVEPPTGELDPSTWREHLRRRVKLLYTAMRALGDDVDGAGTFLVTATRLGGHHGYDPAGAVAPMGGAVTGFAKAFRRERPDALVKAVDFSPGREAAALADVLLAECRRDPGCVEVGHDERGHRWTVGLTERPVVAGTGLALGPESVFVITGAAGSIVSAITTDLAAASGGTFHLLDLTPEPDRADADVARFAFDRDGLKNDLIARMKAAGEKVTPVMVERELARIERLAAARAAIDAVEAAGGTVHYHPVDLTDADAVRAVVEDVRARHEQVDVLVHAAGLEISRFLADKEPSEFDLVFDVKCDGWFNLVRALEGVPLGATVVFSSVAGRFGNAGQTDYSAANDLLCKCTSNLRTTRPGTHAIAIDWTAWAGIGMATRGSIPKMMEAAGIDMLPPSVGIPTVRRELTGSTGGEVLVAGRLGVLLEEPDLTGGIDPQAIDVSGCGPMVGRVVTVGVGSGWVVETTLDPTEQGFLRDHRIDGTPVLPGVMGVEAFAEVARLAVPDWHVVAVEDVDFHAPCKFYRDEPRTLTIRAHVRPDGDDVVAHCRLVGSRLLPNRTEPQVTTHFTGTVRLRPEPPTPPAPDAGAPETGGGVGAEAVYRVYFHGPAYQVIDTIRGSGGLAVGVFASGRPEHHRPAGAPLTMAPRLVELCFQTAGVRELGVEGRWALPTHLDRVAAFGDEGAEGPIVAVVNHRPDGAFDGRVVDSRGRVLVVLEGYRTIEAPDAVDAERLGPLADAMR